MIHDEIRKQLRNGMGFAEIYGYEIGEVMDYMDSLEDEDRANLFDQWFFAYTSRISKNSEGADKNEYAVYKMQLEAAKTLANTFGNKANSKTKKASSNSISIGIVPGEKK